MRVASAVVIAAILSIGPLAGGAGASSAHRITSPAAHRAPSARWHDPPSRSRRHGASVTPTVRRARPSVARPRTPYVVHPARIRVHDGDTFYVGAETIRLRGVDTPELGRPRSAEATWRLTALLRSAWVTIRPRAEDAYGRTVADVYVNGWNVADVLRREGFDRRQPR